MINIAPDNAIWYRIGMWVVTGTKAVDPTIEGVMSFFERIPATSFDFIFVIIESTVIESYQNLKTLSRLFFND